MRIVFLLALLALVFAEIAAFILVGEAIGVLATLGLVLAAIVAGTILLRRLGVATMMRVQAELAARRMPARPLAEGAVLAFAALLIIVPGFVTDVFGALLFIPFVRKALWLVFLKWGGIRPVGSGAANLHSGVVVDLPQAEYTPVSRTGSPWRRDQGQA